MLFPNYLDKKETLGFMKSSGEEQGSSECFFQLLF